MKNVVKKKSSVVKYGYYVFSSNPIVFGSMKKDLLQVTKISEYGDQA